MKLLKFIFFCRVALHFENLKSLKSSFKFGELENDLGSFCFIPHLTIPVQDSYITHLDNNNLSDSYKANRILILTLSNSSNWQNIFCPEVKIKKNKISCLNIPYSRYRKRVLAKDFIFKPYVIILKIIHKFNNTSFVEIEPNNH